MRALATAISVSVALHLVLLFWAHRAEEPLKRAHHKKLVAVMVKNAAKPKPPKPPEPVKITPVHIAHTMPKKVVSKQPMIVEKTVVPPPPPQGFSVDTKATVAQSSVSVAAKEGGGNAFADPSNGAPPGDKVVVRTPPPPPPLQPAQWITEAVDRSPPYPPQALKVGVEGQVLLKVCVGPSGDVSTVTVLKGLGFGIDEAASDWARKRWHFKPARRGGEPVTQCMLQPMRFQLQR